MIPVAAMTARELIQGPLDLPPHVVLLVAGASRASFPEGDATGKQVPVMDDLVETLNLHQLIGEADHRPIDDRNFELIYARLVSREEFSPIARELERRIRDYFSDLSLPDRPTIYDRIVLSLRPKDAVLTFNWDPFLFDAYQRNCDVVPLPRIFFLHGNVRIGACSDHGKWGAKNGKCPECRRTFSEVPLLYPVQQKSYSADPYIRWNWDAAGILFEQAFTLTIFGYSAPASDQDAYELLRQAWYTEGRRDFEHIEIIDTAPQSLLHERWSPFAPTYHYHVESPFEQSQIARWPRRTAESLFYPMSQGEPCEAFPPPEPDRFPELRDYIAQIAGWEPVDGGPHRQ